MDGFGLWCFAKTLCLLSLILLPEATRLISALQKPINKGRGESIPDGDTPPPFGRAADLLSRAPPAARTQPDRHTRSCTPRSPWGWSCHHVAARPITLDAPRNYAPNLRPTETWVSEGAQGWASLSSAVSAAEAQPSVSILLQEIRRWATRTHTDIDQQTTHLNKHLPSCSFCFG